MNSSELQDLTINDKTHWLIYIPTKRYLIWTEFQRSINSESKKLPIVYGTNQSSVAQMRSGDIIWVLSSPESETGILPPTLTARLRVEKVVNSRNARAQKSSMPIIYKQFRWVIEATKQESLFLPLNYPYHTLLEMFRIEKRNLDSHVQRARKGDGEQSPYNTLYQHFQAIRQISSNSGRILEKFVESVLARRTVFLSYKRENFPDAEKLIEYLTKHRIVCWWDTWMIPELEKKAEYNPNILMNFLSDAVKRSYWFVAIVTPGYLIEPTIPGKVWWTMQEWEQAVRIGVSRKIYPEEQITPKGKKSLIPMRRMNLHEDEKFFGNRRITIPLLDRSEPRYQEMLTIGGGEELWLGETPGVEKISTMLASLISGDKS